MANVNNDKGAIDRLVEKQAGVDTVHDIGVVAREPFKAAWHAVSAVVDTYVRWPVKVTDSYINHFNRRKVVPLDAKLSGTASGFLGGFFEGLGYLGVANAIIPQVRIVLNSEITPESAVGVAAFV